jgi:ankyrin repeat protein
LDHGAFVDSLNRDGNTPLFIAVEKGASACVKV